MRSNNIERRVQYNMYAVTIITLIFGIVFYSGFQQLNWFVVLFFMGLKVFLQDRVVSGDQRSNISLGAALVLPTIYLLGATPAMLVSAFQGIYDGIKHKKSWQRTMFNAAQLALSTLLAAVTFRFLDDLLGSSGFGVVIAFVGATVAYLVVNIGLVCRLVSIWKDTSWRTEIKGILGPGFFSHVTSGFIGIIFTSFIMSYGYWGLIVFSGLIIVLAGLLKSAADVSSERALKQNIQKELVIDEMTGAYNFRFLNAWLGDCVEKQEACIFMDIDNFAVFNNTYGHAEGDRVLRLLVETIRENVRTSDYVIRYGGDEFVVVLNGMDIQKARRVAERIMSSLALLKDPCWKQPITVSLGIAARPQHTEDKRQLLLFADQAMYKAKDLGKNNIQMWSVRGSA